LLWIKVLIISSLGALLSGPQKPITMALNLPASGWFVSCSKRWPISSLGVSQLTRKRYARFGPPGVLGVFHLQRRKWEPDMLQSTMDRGTRHKFPRTLVTLEKAVLGLLGLGLLTAGLTSVLGGDGYARATDRVEPGSEPEWTALSACQSTVNDHSFYADIMNHNREETRLWDDRPATAHETTHLIHSYLRTKYSRESHRRVNGFYVGRNRAVIVEEPAITKSSIATFVPKSLRGDRFEHYIEKHQDWDDRALYVFDEWVAYVNDSLVAIEEAAQGRSPGLVNNGIHSCVEFCVYAAAVGMAVEKYDPAYFHANQQFRRFLAWHLKRSMQTYKSGVRFPEFNWKPEYLVALRTSAEAQPVRSFLQERLKINLKDLLE
jgi:hypothetical protein